MIKFVIKIMNLIVFPLCFFGKNIIHDVNSCYDFLLLLELLGPMLNMLNYSKDDLTCKIVIFVSLSANYRK